MSRYFQPETLPEPDRRAPTEAWLFAQALLGKPIPKIVSPEVRARARREELERLAQSSRHHAEELSRLQRAEAEALRERELLEFAAAISSTAESRLKALLREEAAEREAWRRAEAFVARLLEGHGNYDPSKHPRTGTAPNRGYFAATGGAAGRGSATGGGPQTVFAAPHGSGGSGKRIDVSPGSSQWHLPSDDKGTWLGEKGKSTFRLKTPEKVNGKLVRDIEYHQGVPILDKFALPGRTATIVLTGDHDTDIRHAEEAWKRLNPGRVLPKN